ncbi:MAG: PAS domain-containing protein [Deltaproteobacteria bacterium]|jgi:two-component system sensor histidine kinase PilS (NtrC family)|nr:PAS domain-containing protein [Deltaproteobacteria bacterium]
MQWFPRTIEKNRQKWLFYFRLTTNSFLALTIFLIHINGRTPSILDYWSDAVSATVTFFYVMTFAHYLVWPRFLGPAPQIVIQMAADILWASVLLVLTGGCDSTVNFIFIIVVINSAFLGGLKISFIAATLSTGAWAAILDLHYYGYLPGLPHLFEYMGTTELALNILVNTGASYLVAVLGGYLSTQLEISSQALVTSQASLDRLSELNDHIIRSIDSGLITVDGDELVLSVNQAALDILQVLPQDILVRPWRSLFPGLGQLGRAVGELPENMLVHGARLRHERRSDQAELILELSVMALVDENGHRWGRLLVVKDETAISQMEAEIKRSEHMAAVGGMAAGLAHEIRTPLASMTGSWHMLLGQSLSAEDHNRLMIIIGREMERLQNLVDDFLTFARPSVGRPQSVDLNRLIEDQVHVFRSWKGAEAEIELVAGEAPNVFFDSGQLNQVVFNLIQNAMEAAVPERPVKVRLATSLDRQRPGHVRLDVTDNGCGIGEEEIKRVFEPFFSTKSKGTGLGLATVWGIVCHGNGFISVSSQPGATTFTVSLPSAEGRGVVDARPPLGLAPSPAGA